ncbi:MAG TPA: ROK family transcriptional regulator [Pyrinomonadaceae bacterium]|jgi:predicted NBD/HSP70 family sugar kinase
MDTLSDVQTITTAAETAAPAKTARMLLRMVRAAQPISRIELARRLGINRSTVTDIFKPLISAGILREEPLKTASGTSRLQGRPPVGISFNSDNGFFVGVNLGVRRSQVGLTTLSGEILAETEFETPSESVMALESIRKNVRELCRKISGRKLKAIGVSVPGPTDAERSRLLYAPHLGWHNLNIADELRNSCEADDNVPIIVENDATAAALYEARLHLRNTDEGVLKNFVLLRSGTGIGIGMVIEGEVYRGAGVGQGIAGEFGHMTIVAGGKPCVCGNRGCWEKYASAAAASSLYAGDRVSFGGAVPPRFIQIVERAEAGEIRAQRTLEKLGEYLGIGIGNVITGLGVPHIIVSGRLVYGWKYIKQPLFDAVGKSMAGKLSDWTVECGEPKGAAIGGAFEVAVEEFLMHHLIA